jgi:hypothetical protein
VIALHAVDGRSLKSIDVVQNGCVSTSNMLFLVSDREAFTVTHIVVDLRIRLEYDFDDLILPASSLD